MSALRIARPSRPGEKRRSQPALCRQIESDRTNLSQFHLPVIYRPVHCSCGDGIDLQFSHEAPAEFVVLPQQNLFFAFLPYRRRNDSD